MMWSIVLLAKATLVLALTAALLQMLYRTSASLRHALCVLAMAAVLILPVLMGVMPAWRVALLPAETAVTPNLAGSTAALRSADVRIGTAAESAPHSSSSATRSMLRNVSYPLIVWLGGVAAVVAWVLAGRAVLARVRRRAVAVHGGWSHVLAAERARLSVRAHVQLLFSAEVTAPLTWGVVRPVIVLPSEALEWDADRQHVVLRHELAHVLRRDAMTQLLAGIACALYWFHPGVWWLSRRLRVERESACDDIVLAGGVSGTSYASHLLDVARTARSLHATNMVSIAMASPSSFERRLLSVLDDAAPRSGRALPRAAVACAVTAVLILAAFQPVARAAIPIMPPSIVNASLQPVQSAARQTDLAREVPRSRIGQLGVAPAADTTVRFRVAPGGTLYLTLNTGGDIDVRGTAEDMVTVTAALQGSPTELRFESVTRGVQVWSRKRGDEQLTQTSHRFTVTVPRQYNLRIESAGGSVTIRDVEGSISGTTGGGAVDIARARGRINLTTGGGDVNVSDSNLTGDVGTGAGEVLIRNVTGGLRGTSGHGDVTYSNSSVSLADAAAQKKDLHTVDAIKRARDERLHELAAALRQSDKNTSKLVDEARKPVDKAGVAMRIDRARAGRYVTGGGDIIIDATESGVTLGTGGGNIRVGAARGSLEASTGAGDIEIRVDAGSTELLNITATTGSGRVILVLPSNVSARLELDATYTNEARPADIASDFTLSVRKPLEWDTTVGSPRRHVLGSAVLGSGDGRIRVYTVNGDIIVRRER